MKIFSGICALIVLILVLCFALSNRQPVSVGMWPFTGAIDAPLYLVGLVPLVCGFFVGGLGGWLTGVPHRLRARRLHKELGVLSEKFSELQKNALLADITTAPKKPFWRR